ncbi:MAG: hypothetical protein R2879_21435 [Saprospiraceae bacterium]
MHLRSFLLLLSLFFIQSTSAQDNDPWIIRAASINPANYYGITVANGMVGLVSSPEPMKVKDVVLNGVYDNYQRGRVSNILKTFNHINMELDVNGRRIGRGNIQDYRQELDMQYGILKTTYNIGDSIKVEHQLMSLRHLPFCAMSLVKISATKDVVLTPMSVIEAPDHLIDVRNVYAEIDRSCEHSSHEFSCQESHR